MISRKATLRIVSSFALSASICVGLSGLTLGQEAATQAEAQSLKAAGGKLQLEAPANWKSKQPSVRIIEHELSVPAVGQDKTAGRITMMSAGGSIKANLDRWKGQFQAGAKVSQSDWEWDEHKVTLLDMTGTYNDRRGPFAPPTARTGYRMLGAVVEVKSGGLYFVKFYGPEQTVNENAAAFRLMLGKQ